MSTPVVRAAANAAHPEPTLPGVFRAVCHAEFIKLRTVSSTLWTAALTVALTLGLGGLITGLEVSRWDRRTLTEVIGFDPILYSFAALPLAQLVIGVLGVLIMTSEYATGTIAVTFAATPQRLVLFGAKITAFAGVVLALGLVSCLSVFFLCQALLARVDADVSITDAGVLVAVLGGAVHLVVVGVIAVGVGAVVRHTAGAVALLFGVFLILPGLVSLLPSPWNDDVTKYLPSSAGVAMSAVVQFPNLLSPLNGFLLLCGYAALTVLGAALVLRRRDA